MDTFEQQTRRDLAGTWTYWRWIDDGSGDSAIPTSMNWQEPPSSWTFEGSERYRVLERIGSGGMAHVYAAFDIDRAEPVALKIATDTRFARRQLVHEANVLRRFAHPNIVTVLDTGFVPENRPFYTMEIVPGVTLRALVRERGPLPPERITKVVTELCGAVSAIHGAGFVHHDLTPSNVMVDCADENAWRICLIDFGLARSRDQTLDRRCIVGTPGYISPEIVNGEPSDCRADIYGIGAVSMFMHCGHDPTPNTGLPNRERTRISVKSSAIGHAIRRCMRERPDERFATAAEVADFLSGAHGTPGNVARVVARAGLS